MSCNSSCRHVYVRPEHSLNSGRFLNVNFLFDNNLPISGKILLDSANHVLGPDPSQGLRSTPPPPSAKMSTLSHKMGLNGLWVEG